MIKVRSINAASIASCKELQILLNDGYTIVRADRTGDGYYVIYILEKK